MRFFSIIAFICLLPVAALADAAKPGDTSQSHAQMSTRDHGEIVTLLKAQFDRPDAPLSVAPVTIVGPVAVAGWSQEGMGGRAFLRKDHQGWFVEVCAGGSLVQAKTFVAMGLSEKDAEILAHEVNRAESSADQTLIDQFDSFEGTVVIGRGNEHGHNAGHGHQQEHAHDASHESGHQDHTKHNN